MSTLPVLASVLYAYIFENIYGKCFVGYWKRVISNSIRSLNKRGIEEENFPCSIFAYK